MGQIKGVAVIDAVKALRKLRAVALAVLPEHVHSYLDTRILISSWYSEADFLELLRGLEKVIPDPGMDKFEWIGRLGARSDFTGVYAGTILKGRPLETLRRYPRMWRLYHDSGKVEVEAGETGGQVTISHYLVTFEEFCRVQNGHFAELLTLVGAADVTVRNTRIGSDSEPGCWEINWKP